MNEGPETKKENSSYQENQEDLEKLVNENPHAGSFIHVRQHSRSPIATRHGNDSTRSLSAVSSRATIPVGTATPAPFTLPQTIVPEIIEKKKKRCLIS